MTDSILPRIPVDVGNATTFPFPVRYKVVKGALFARVRTGDSTLNEPFIEAAQDLEREGVKAIATGCGFFAAYHQELVNAVHIPVFSSSLLQVHLARMVIRPEQKVGVITASS
jgi:precorrin-4 methylase